MSITLSISGIPICGSHGDSITIPTMDCWLIYCNYVQKQIAEDRPCAVLRKFATWTIDRNPIQEPKTFFITLTDSEQN